MRHSAARFLDGVRTSPWFLRSWGQWRQRQFHRGYEDRRERYAREAGKRGLAYRAERVGALVQERLARRGWRTTRRAMGSIHTLAFIPDIGWHRHLVPDLRALGRLSWFDYAALGFSWDEFAQADREAIRRRADMNQRFWDYIVAVHRAQPVDWIFIYASGLELSASTLRRVRDELGIPLVGMCLDDKNSWEGPWMGDHRAGQVDIASALDLAWTSARVACEWYLVEGGCPIYMPEGFEAGAFAPSGVPQDIPASFVGSAYGFRPKVIEHVRRHDLPLRVFGRGWPRGEFARDPVEIYNRSRINLGLGETGYSEMLTNVKGRDFEIPATGGGAYLTSFNADLAQHYVLGEEILCYRGPDDLVEQLRHYLAHPDLTQEIAARARARSLREHRWLHRYVRICDELGILLRPLSPPAAGVA